MTLFLIIVSIAVIGIIGGILYFFYKQVFARREKYFQFDEEAPASNVLELVKIGGLEKIEEVDEGTNTVVSSAHQTNGQKIKDRKSSDATVVTPSEHRSKLS